MTLSRVHHMLVQLRSPRSLSPPYSLIHIVAREVPNDMHRTVIGFVEVIETHFERNLFPHTSHSLHKEVWEVGRDEKCNVLKISTSDLCAIVQTKI